MPMQKEYINWAPLQGMLARRNQQDEAEQQSRAEQGMAMGQQAIQALLSSMSESEQAKRDRENREFQMNLHRMGTDERREENNATRAYEAAKWRQEQENRKAEKEAELKRRQIDDENERNRYEQSNMLGRNQLHWQRQYQQQQIELEKQRLAQEGRLRREDMERKRAAAATGSGVDPLTRVGLELIRGGVTTERTLLPDEGLGLGTSAPGREQQARGFDMMAENEAMKGNNLVAEMLRRKAAALRSGQSQQQQAPTAKPGKGGLDGLL